MRFWVSVTRFGEVRLDGLLWCASRDFSRVIDHGGEIFNFDDGWVCWFEVQYELWRTFVFHLAVFETCFLNAGLLGSIREPIECVLVANTALCSSFLVRWEGNPRISCVAFATYAWSGSRSSDRDGISFWIEAVELHRGDEERAF